MSLSKQILTGTNTTPPTQEELRLARMIEQNNVSSGFGAEGDSCDDGNPETINDVYTAGKCVGTNVEGQACDDGNIGTENDIYINGNCIGIVRTGTCDDGNPQTINDVYNASGVCEGTNVEGQSCDDGNPSTRDTIYTNGVCTGGIESIYIQNGKYSDGTKANTCWEYMNGKTISSKEYLKADESLSKTSFYLSDGRIAKCDFQALRNIHNSNDWSLLFKPDSTAQCYNNNGTSTFIYAGGKGRFFPHPTNTGKCSGSIITNGMFKTLTFKEEIGSPNGDGVNFSIDGDKTNSVSFYLSPTSTKTQTVTVGSQVNIATFNTNGRNNSYDWSTFTITSYSE